MIRIQYTAARQLTGTHVSGDPVTLSFSASELTPGREVTRVVQKAIGGRRETLRQNATRTWSVATEPLDGVKVDAMLEFLASVEGGEAFSFEPWRYESGASLDLDLVSLRLRRAEAVQCVLDSESWQLSRLLGVGTGGSDDYYQVTFTVREDVS